MHTLVRTRACDRWRACRVAPPAGGDSGEGRSAPSREAGKIKKSNCHRRSRVRRDVNATRIGPLPPDASARGVIPGVEMAHPRGGGTPSPRRAHSADSAAPRSARCA